MTSLFYLLIAIAIAIFQLIAFIHVLLYGRQPQAALAWAVVILSLPFFGSCVYFLFGINRVDSRASKLLYHTAQKRGRENRDDEYKGALYNLKKEELLKYANENTSLFRVGLQNSILPPILGNNFTPLYNGDQAYPLMLEAIYNAKQEVYFSSYIFSGKQMGKKFADAFLDAHKRGVEVRVLIDGLSAALERDPSIKMLENSGVKVAKFLPPKIFPPQFSINLRNHRKILVCDNVAFTGGMNISDEHCLNFPREQVDHYIQDLHFLCEGYIVARLRETFLMDWAFVTDHYDAPPQPKLSPAGNMFARTAIDGPGSAENPIQSLFCDVCSCAKKRIVILNPYFLLPRELKSALVSAVARGVEVSIILPEKLDHLYIAWASAHTLPELLKSGLKLYYQPEPFAHTKLLLIDDMYTCFGSTNLDPRSLALNFEMNIEVFSDELNADLTRYTDAILAKSKECKLEELNSLSLFQRMRNAAVWLLSPYL